MFSKWPIRNKLFVGMALLLVIIGTLSWGGIRGLYAYRELVRNLGRRVNELPLANQFIQDVNSLRVTLSDVSPAQDMQFSNNRSLSLAMHVAQQEFRLRLDAAHLSLKHYREQLVGEQEVMRIGDSHREWATVKDIESTLVKIEAINQAGDWLLDRICVSQLTSELQTLQELGAKLPTYLHENISEFTEEARVQYRALLVLTWITSTATIVLLTLWVRLFYQWVFRPLRLLIRGSRKVADGQFDYSIHLDTQDEMADLASAMNQMTRRFRDIRDDLDRQVQERTKQVVRSEQLASVGFLAAGVAHEINNPLASIAMCAESLEDRLLEAGCDNEELTITRQYLQMIQNEAFRCKEITEKLLDFSRMGDVRRQPTDLRELVQGVIDMIRHLDRYDQKGIDFAAGPAVVASINAQQIKQVVLNLIVNGLDSLDEGGTVTVALREHQGEAEISIRDNGCGMTPEVQQHLFEPFFTRRRGGQGTGLGLSIVYRIIADHEGSIEAESAGPGQGSEFRVSLPLAARTKEMEHYQAA